MTTNYEPTTDPRCNSAPAPYVIYLNGECLSKSQETAIIEIQTYAEQSKDYTAPDGGLVVLICLPVLLALMWLNRR